MSGQKIEVRPSSEQIRHEIALSFANGVMKKASSYNEKAFVGYYINCLKFLDGYPDDSLKPDAAQ